MAMIDKTQIVYEALTAASTLATEIGTNCWSPVAPEKWDGSTSAVIYHQSDATSHLTGATHLATFVFKCYGDDNTYNKAREVYELLYDRMQMLSETQTSGKIITARLITDSQLPPEPETQYKAHVAQFSIMFEG